MDTRHVGSWLQAPAPGWFTSPPTGGEDPDRERGWDTRRVCEPEDPDNGVTSILGFAFAVLGGIAIALAATRRRQGNKEAWAIAWYRPILLGRTPVIVSTPESSLPGPEKAWSTAHDCARFGHV